MAHVKPEWAEYQRKRWLRNNAHLWIRPDAHRFLRPDYRRFLQPGTESWWLHLYFEGKANFNPDQLRVPAGNSGGGRWTGDGSGAARRDNSSSHEISANKRAALARLGSRPHGHHYVSLGIYGKMNLSPETRRVFDEAKTRRLHGQVHRNSKEHELYTEAVKSLLDKFMIDRNIHEEAMTPRQAKTFVDSIKRSDDPRIRDFNMRIWRRELFYWIRRGARRWE